ncbi:WD repeat domain 22 [Rhodotorula toruloides]|uniref:WD repeat domain 22 n=1 Tax=Rhodotorula toruloides TaxID=5286 RepID=A0A511KL95_RHOTO|nr:WD repeat domain 22 [Rhodotorula toruloides]
MRWRSDPQKSNLFAIAFSCDGQRILAAGNDSTILEYDLETTRQIFPSPLHSGIPPCDGWFDHDDSIMGLAAHPSNPYLFLAASADGTLRSHDVRIPNPVSVLPDVCAMNDIAYHPLTPEMMVYAGDDGQVGLLDARTAWRDPSSGPASRVHLARDVAVVQYEARLTRRKTASSPLQCAAPGISSAVFSSSGSIICATLSGHLPTLYELNDPSPLANFASPGPPDSAPLARPMSSPSSERHSALSFPHGYRNTTTTKHDSFGGSLGASPGDGLLYAAGSDDFRVYVWEVPCLEALKEQRCKLEKDQLRTGDMYFRKDDISPFIRPFSISPASSLLTGHRSVVNTALFHPNVPLLYTSGVEKIVIRHSAPTTSLLSAHVPSSHPTNASIVSSPPQPPPPPSWSFTPRTPATHSHHPGLFGPPDPALDTALQAGETPVQREIRLREEDLSVLEYFDGLVEGEGEEAIWDEGGMRFAGNSEDESEDEDEDEELNSEEEAMINEFLENQGTEGTTRRMLNAIYQLRGSGGSSSDEEQ